MDDDDGSEIFKDIEEKDLEFSTIVSVGKMKNTNEEKNKLNELYKTCFNNIEEINCRKNIDELLDENNLMNKEKKLIKEVKDKYNLHFNNNTLLNDKLYEEMKTFVFNDMLLIHPKIEKNILIISNYMDNDETNINKIKEKDNKNPKVLFKEIIPKYLEIKKLLNGKY